MSEKIKMISSKNNRALVDECNLEEYLERGWKVGWPEDEVIEETVEAEAPEVVEEKTE